MANPFVKAWKYLMALFDNKIEENADPKVQIEQAIEEAQRQHQELSQQAAAVIGNQRQLEMQLNRRLAEVEKLQGNARQALELADQARAKGDENKAVEYENAAEAFAAQLVTAEESVEDTKKLHDQALQQAEKAKNAVQRNNAALREKVNERSKLLSQLEQAKMQEKVSESLNSMNELTPMAIPHLWIPCAIRLSAAIPRHWGKLSSRRTRWKTAWPRYSKPACRWLGTPAWSKFAAK